MKRIPLFSTESVLSRGSRSGVALVLTLAMIVLVTILILGLLSYSTANRQIENSRADQVEAEQLARTAKDYVTGRFVQEITNSSYSTVLTYPGGATLYRPLNATNSVPIRAINSVITSGGSAANFYNLIRQSIPTADANASTDNTATPSENGRLISTNRWNAPVLLSGTGFTATNQLPNWIYVNKATGISSTSSTNVIGRFAYNVYDISGLLDANVAGFPSTVTATTMKGTPAGQGTVAGADLTLLGATQSAIDELCANFRSPNGDPYYTNQVSAFAQTGFLSNATTYTNYAAGDTTGTAYTNSYFVNRQDFLRYVQTENTGLTNALPYLTTFSRTLNAPSWGPTTNSPPSATLNPKYAYQNLEDSQNSTNRFIPNVRYSSGTMASASAPSFLHYNDDGTYVTNYVNAGDPLVQRRFSLAKLAWILSTGPNTAAFNPSLTSTQIAQAIQACFGLVWDSTYTLTGTTTVDPAWIYVGSDPSVSSGSTTAQTAIETLNSSASTSTPAGENREPNFFELLKAGILSGSLGDSIYSSTYSATTYPPYGLTGGGIGPDTRNADYQIIRIGANIIDQYKSDAYPTAIAFGSVPYVFWGMEDLPYFEGVAPEVMQWSYPSPPAQPYIIYQIWNPNQPSTSATTGPSNFQVRIGTAADVPATYEVQYVIASTSGVNTYGYPYNPPTEAFDQTDEPPVPFTVNFSGTTSGRLSSNAQSSYREPHVIRDNTQAVQTGPGKSGYNHSLFCNPTELPAPSNPAEAPGIPSPSNNFTMILSNTVFIWFLVTFSGIEV